MIALRLCAAGQEARGCDAASSRLIDVLDAQNAGSFLTLCWREPDSNPRSPVGKQDYSRLAVRVFRTGLLARATGSSYRKSQGPLPAVILRKPRA